MTLSNPVVSVVAPPASFTLEFSHGSAFELLVALYAVSSQDKSGTWVPETAAACPPATREALAALADPTGELWLHLLGIPLVTGATGAAELVDHVRRMKAVEIRRHLFGLHMPSWCRAIGAATIEKAARGEQRGAEQFVAAAFDYCADSAQWLAGIVPLGLRETKTRVVTALDLFEREVLRTKEKSLRAELAEDADAKRHLLATTDPDELITTATGGFRYEHVAPFERVLLFPHLAGAPAVLLCEHQTTYVIGYPVQPATAEPSLLAIGRALGDASRIAILTKLREGETGLAELADALGLAKSTTHHHLVQLRAAGLISVQGNLNGRRYELDVNGLLALERFLARFRAGVSGRP